ncbi:NAD(P)-binding domain-containing protein [Isoptericola sp. 4D.3]|uniref:NAD(P)-binding domain-containing protein n=1 Tax=Isoptericola peretonis TaxID=2918523 RepID=A0ABT0J4A2_9MICO|nr:NAD(P)-binding domain-containing protein [Isoptericola sp. 4D.3]
MSTLGIVGSGSIGSAVARLAVAAGIDVVVANSRGPQTLAGLVDELGPLASAGTVDHAAAADQVVLSVPLTAIEALDPHLFDGKVVLDTTNYYPFRDGRIARLDSGEVTCGELVQEHFAGARLVKAFSNIVAPHIPQLARPATADDRTALPIAGDDAAKAEAAELVDRLGFLTVDAGALADAWRFEPGSEAYTPIYLADPATPLDQLMEAPAAPVSPARLSRHLEAATRVDVAERQF